MRTKPTTAKQKTPVPEEKYEEQKSLERYELEKRTKLLIKSPEELRLYMRPLERLRLSLVDRP